ncbi:MAG: hypothetical protein ACXABI_05205 [Candidatus Hodarchaeales archaeon]|jgi:hypothetical protein
MVQSSPTFEHDYRIGESKSYFYAGAYDIYLDDPFQLQKRELSEDGQLFVIIIRQGTVFHSTITSQTDSSLIFGTRTFDGYPTLKEELLNTYFLSTRDSIYRGFHGHGLNGSNSGPLTVEGSSGGKIMVWTPRDSSTYNFAYYFRWDTQTGWLMHFSLKTWNNTSSIYEEEFRELIPDESTTENPSQLIFGFILLLGILTFLLSLRYYLKEPFFDR